MLQCFLLRRRGSAFIGWVMLDNNLVDVWIFNTKSSREAERLCRANYEKTIAELKSKIK